MYIYVIEARTKTDHKVSSVCYQTYEEAKRFVERRYGNPQEITPWIFKQDDITYEIHELTKE